MDKQKTTELGKHYAGGVECIDAMETTIRAWAEAGQPEAGLCFAQVLRYLMRPSKGQVSRDLEKAQDYLNRGRNHVDGVGGRWRRADSAPDEQRPRPEPPNTAQGKQ